MEDVDEPCNTRLCLGLAMGGYVPPEKKQKLREEAINNVNHHPHQKEEDLVSLKIRMEDEDSDEHIRSTSCRKKLRLSKEQSDMLEDSFKLHTSPNPVQKLELALLLNLKPRQVEVWFQNRRARKKLKQTEEECELLKKCCENLRDENQRLKKEVEELRAMKLKVEVEAPSSSSSSPQILCNIFQLSKVTTLAMCSSCKKPIWKPNNDIDEEKKTKKKKIDMNANGDNNIISEFVVPEITE